MAKSKWYERSFRFRTNIECNDQNLVDFAELGSALFKSLYPNEKPKVSLLNIGSEEIKGTEMLKTASKKLRA